MAIPRPDIVAFLDLFLCFDGRGGLLELVDIFVLPTDPRFSVTSVCFRCVNTHLLSRTDLKGLLVTCLDSEVELRMWFDAGRGATHRTTVVHFDGSK
jgi:hypothetical protein